MDREGYWRNNESTESSLVKCCGDEVDENIVNSKFGLMAAELPFVSWEGEERCGKNGPPR